MNAIDREPSVISHPETRSGAASTIAAALIIAALAVFLTGTAWDVQWHRAIGRDRLLTLPHIVMLAGIATAGTVSLTALVFSAWSRRTAGARAVSDTLRHESGIVLAGVGALLAAVAFPLDDYWHALYGIDVTLWAPFHMMIDTGLGLAGVGASVQLAAHLTAGRPLRSVLFALALAVTDAVFLVLIAESVGIHGLQTLGDTTVAVYPILLSLAVPILVLPPLIVSGRTGTAMLVVGFFLSIRQFLFVFVPWATAAFAGAEGLSFRPSAPWWTITPNAYPGLSLVLVAVAGEIGLWWGRRSRTAVLAVLLTAMPAAFVDRPWTMLVPLFYEQPDITAVGVAAVPWAIMGTVVGTLVGYSLARAITPRGHPHVSSTGRPPRSLAHATASATALLVMLLVGAAPTHAHDISPVSSAPARLGPYLVEVRYYAEPVGSRALPFEIVPSFNHEEPTDYIVTAVPGPGTDAVPVRAQLARAYDHAGVTGIVNLPVSGRWLLSIEADGPLGQGGGEAPIVAAPPAAAMPEWTAWMIGLAPVWVLLGFLIVRDFAFGSAMHSRRTLAVCRLTVTD